MAPWCQNMWELERNMKCVLWFVFYCILLRNIFTHKRVCMCVCVCVYIYIYIYIYIYTEGGGNTVQIEWMTTDNQ
jgi:hypothetical protein